MHPAVAVLEYHLAGYRRLWLSTVVSSLTTPVLFLLTMGVAMGTFVDRGGSLGVPYLQFLAPGLLASSGLQLAMTESGAPVMANFKFKRTYFGMAAAPLRAVDMILGELSYLAFRVALAAIAFLLVMTAFGAVRSAWAVLTPAVVVLVAMAGAAPMFAYSATVNSTYVMMVMLRFGMLPMTLFSGVFFPVEQLPMVVRPLAYALPLWHGVQLCRAASLGAAIAWLTVAMHLGVIGLWFAAGFALARARFTKRLTV